TRGPAADAGATVYDQSSASVELAPTASLEPPSPPKRHPRFLAAALLMTLAMAATVAVTRLATVDDLPARSARAPADRPAIQEASDAPQEAYPLFLAGREKLRRFDKAGALDEALDLFEQALSVDPRHAPSLAGLAEGSWLKFAETRDAMWLDRAEIQARSAVDANGHLAAAQRSLGLVLVERGDEAAEGHLEAALHLEPSSARSHWAAAVGQKRRGDLDRAIKLYREATVLAPGEHFYFDELGGALFAASRLDEAEEALRRSLEIAEDGLYARSSLAAVLQMTGRSAEATVELQRALEIRPSSALYGNLGGVLFYRGLYRQAAKAFESALDFGGAQHYLHWANAGDAYRFINGAEAR
ncbi:MAG: tetratricopeptide repeat protein, partial [Acidobacteriota bacterium]